MNELKKWIIYVDRILFYAKLHPVTNRPMTFKKYSHNLYVSVNDPRAIAVNGAAILDLLDSDEELVLIVAKEIDPKKDHI